MTTNKIVPVPLSYQSEIGTCKNVLLIDSSLKASEQFYTSANSETYPIIYSATSQKSDLLEVLRKFTTIDKLAFAFKPNNGHNKVFMDSKTFLSEETTNFIVSVVKEFQIKEVDFLADSLNNYANWTSFFETIKTQTGVIIENNGKAQLKEKNTAIYFNSIFDYPVYLYDDIDPFVYLNTPTCVASTGKYIYVGLIGEDRIVRVDALNPAIIVENYIVLPTGYEPSSIMIHGNDLYVGSGNPSFSCVGKYTFNRNGTVSGTHNFVTIPGYSVIRGITESNGIIYCSDAFNSRIIKFSANSPGSVDTNVIQNSGLDYNQGIVANGNYLYICNIYSNSIARYELNAVDNSFDLYWLSIDPNGGRPFDITVADNVLYITYDVTLSNPTVNKQYVAKYDLNTNTYNSRYRSIETSLGCCAFNTYLYVTSWNNNYVARFDLTIESMEIYAGYNGSQAKRPRYMVRYGDYIYTANYGNPTDYTESSISRLHVTSGEYIRNFIPHNDNSTTYIYGRPMTIAISDIGGGYIYLWVLTTDGYIGRYQINTSGNWVGTVQDWARNINPNCNGMIMQYVSGSRWDLYMANYTDKYIARVVDIFTRDTRDPSIQTSNSGWPSYTYLFFTIM